MKIMSSIWSQPEVDWNLTIKWTVDRWGETIIWYSLFFKHTDYHHTVLKMKAITLLLILLLTMTNIQANYLFDLELAGEYRIKSQNFICSKYYSLKYSGGHHDLYWCKTLNIYLKCCSKCKSRDCSSWGFQNTPNMLKLIEF